MKSARCTYNDCFKHFKGEKTTKNHKSKEHIYCKRCDHDFTDDLDMLIHQIESPNHMACPVCGIEMKSRSGRDDHIERNHPQKQNLKCRGCENKFTRAAALMFHIENDECEVIRLEHFERQRAEKQVAKDAMETAFNSHGGSCIAPSYAGSEADTNGGISLLDDENEHISRDWAGNPMPSSGPAPTPVVRSGNDLTNVMSNLTLDKFPTLPPLSAAGNKTESALKIPTVECDLLDFNMPEQRHQMESVTTGPWAKAEAGKSSKLLFPANKAAFPSTTASQLDRFDNMSNGTAATDDKSVRLETSGIVTDLASSSPTTPAGSKPERNDPNALHTQVKTTKSLVPSSTLDPNAYWNSLLEKFDCPGQKCRRQFDTAEEFTAHLVSGVHVGGKTQCPSCLKQFGSTTALISHCESGNKRCMIRKSANYNQVMRELTGGLLGTEGSLSDGSVRYTANRAEDW